MCNTMTRKMHVSALQVLCMQQGIWKDSSQNLAVHEFAPAIDIRDQIIIMLHDGKVNSKYLSTQLDPTSD